MAKASDTTELKLASTATYGVAAEHSPYYRRLLSAGYKGYIQGMLGGAGYYGALGAAVGTLVAIPAFFLFPPLGASIFMLIPAAAGAGIIKGANTFGNIGSTAAINAESADMSEQRRSLIDRLGELPKGPEGAKEAAIIKEELYRIEHPTDEHPFFHWKTVLVCAAIGAVVALSFSALLPMGAALVGHAALVGEILEAAHIAAIAPYLTPITAALGAAIGGTIGIDRHYVRRWFDGTEKVLYDESHVQDAMRERQLDLQRLHNAAIADDKLKTDIEQGGHYGGPHLETATNAHVTVLPHETTATKPAAELDQPDTTINAAQYQSRLAEIQKAMATPAV